MDINSDFRTAADNPDYQQRLICNSSEIITDGRFKPLQMTFSVVVISTV
jgi:hypothetical protein